MIEEQSSAQKKIKRQPSPAKQTETNQAGIFDRLRRWPRSVWLGLSASLLIVASISWYVRERHWRYAPLDSPPFLSAAWWNQALVRNPAAGLPEISGHLYSVAIERRHQPERIWVAGTGGFLAYSDDDGGCWVRFEYDKEKGEFHEPAIAPCMLSEARSRWPDLVPTVLAAEPFQSRSVPSQSIPQPQLTAPSNITATSDGQQSASRSSGQILIDPPSADFGNVQLPESTLNQSSNVSNLSVPFTITNNAKRTVQMLFDLKSAFAKEFSLDTAECRVQLAPGEKCRIHVVFTPQIQGRKDATLLVRNAFTVMPTTANISAFVQGGSRQDYKAGSSANSGEIARPPVTPKATSASAQNAPGVAQKRPGTSPTAPVQTSNPAQSTEAAKSKPPSAAPDLLAIDFSPNGEIVSTGGMTWILEADNRNWTFRNHRPGDTRTIGGFTWTFAGPGQGGWATETRIGKLTELNLPNAPFKCGTCTIRSKTQASEDGEAWAAGWEADKPVDHALLFRSRDRGATWQPLTRGGLAADQRASAVAKRLWMWPPRWYLAMLVLCLVLALPALLPPPDRPLEDTEKSKIGGVEGRLSSDKPLEPDDLDVLGLTSIALGLSRFLRNKKTLPPLTVAINGEWGTGKSSLMNLLRCDLKSYGMCPVWFNAWHHQKEEHLLAALLQTVRLEAVPPLWNLLGVPFRWRLLMQRLQRRWPVLLVIAVVVTFTVGLDYHLRAKHNTDLFLWFIGQFVPSSFTPKTPPPQFPIQGGLLAVFALIGTLWKGLTAFGANPAALLASVAEGNKMKDLEAQTSFRQKFAVEFRDFTRALGPQRPLVIFIDDLDRCLPGNVRDVLEAVNFLVASGDCFVVLGMDRVQVQRAVGLSFKEVAEEAEPKQNGNSAQSSDKAETVAASRVQDQPISKSGDDTETARGQRREFAQRYLEKLINLEVRVPLALDEVTKSKLFERPPEKREEPLKEGVLRIGLETIRALVPVALTVLVVFGAWHLSTKSVPLVETWIKMPVEATSQASNGQLPQLVTPPTPPKISSATKPDQNAAPPSGAPIFGELVTPFPGAAPSITDGKQAWPATWILWLPLYVLALFLLLVVQVVLTTRPGVETHDSRQFTDAMEKVWYPLVLAKQNTPRAAKRFVNRVRYLAMRQRGQQEKVSWWENVLFPQRLKEPLSVLDWSPIPEPLLVALAAIEQTEPAWIYLGEEFRALVDCEDSKLFPQEAETLKYLQKCREAHKQAFSTAEYVEQRADWHFLPSYRDTFLKIWPRVTPEETV